MSCDRCRRPYPLEDLEAVNIGDQGITLCQRCSNTFWRRFQAFMVGH